MSKIESFYNSCKLEVETFSFNYATDTYECDCCTPGVPEEIESEAIIKHVTTDELKDAVCNPDGYVYVTHYTDPENTEPVPFWRWSADMRNNNRIDLMDILEEIINKREARTNEWTAKHDVAMSFADPFGDTFTAIQSITKQNAA